MTEGKTTYTLGHVQFSGGNHGIPTATVRLNGPDGEVIDASDGNSLVGAVCKAIARAIGCTYEPPVDLSIQVQSIYTESTVALKIHVRGTDYIGEGRDVDIILAVAKAYLDAVNLVLAVPESQ